MDKNKSSNPAIEVAPEISAVICTRNRGYGVLTTLASIIANTHPNFEIILVDQSTNSETADAVQDFCKDRRFRYIHSETTGTGRSRNIGLQAARGKIVAYADDDTKVNPDWLERTQSIFEQNPKVGLVFCAIDSGPHDASNGYIPDFSIPDDFIITKISDCFTHELGIGAGMAVQKEIAEKVGGFDDNIGPGATFRAGEDRDIAIRLLLKGWQVYLASHIKVIHFGYRSYIQGKEHTRRDFYGLGATYIKPIKCGYLSAAVIFISIPLIKNFIEPIFLLLQLKQQLGFGKLFYFIQGAIRGFLTPVDRVNILYK